MTFRKCLEKGGERASVFMLAACIVAAASFALTPLRQWVPALSAAAVWQLQCASLKCLAAASAAAMFLVRDWSGGLVIAAAGGCFLLSLLSLHAMGGI